MPADDKISLLDPASMECPFANYTRLHERGTAHEEPGIGFAVTRYDDLQRLARDTQVFSSNWAGVGSCMLMMGQSTEPLSPEVEKLVASYPHQMPNALATDDGAAHARHKSLVLKALNAHRVQKLEPHIREIVDDLIDGFVDAGRVEFMRAFGGPLPTFVNVGLLGLPRKDVPMYAEWVGLLAEGFIEPIGNERRAVVARAVIAYQNEMLRHIAERRARRTDDLLSDLVHVEVEEGDELDGVRVVGPKRMGDAELLAIMIQLFTAGSHTTMGLLGNAMVFLCQRPDVQAELRADPSLIPAFIDEMLRLESPVQATVRRTTRQGTYFGREMPGNVTVFPMWGAANQDARQFENPREFDMRRPHVKKHLAFGHGPHFCVGSAVALTEARIAFETLLRRLEDIRFAPDDGAGGPPHALAQTFLFRMQRHVHVEFRRAR